MNAENWHSRLLSMVFFPDTAYLAARWWHRLALVLFWIWVLFAGATAIHNLWDIYEGFEYAHAYAHDPEFDFNPWDRATENTFHAVVWLLSVFVAVGMYRLLLFIGVGHAWKEAPVR